MLVMAIRFDDPRPPYLQVADDLQRQIATGDLSPGQQLPSTRELAAKYEIAQMTAQNAVRVLRDQGLVTSQQGRGVFVHQGAPERLLQDHEEDDPNLEQIRQLGIVNAWPEANQRSAADLLRRVAAARSHITIFGLTRNFYVWDNVLPSFEAKASHIPITFYVMHPFCESRRDRYRLEPLHATLDDPHKYIRDVLQPLREASLRVQPKSEGAGLHLFTYNFPASFSMDNIDNYIRFSVYGLGKRGTDSPILELRSGTPYFDYFRTQLEWLKLMAVDPPAQWTRKGIRVAPLTEEDFREQRRELPS